jgi:type IV secretory pathway VirB6-like protein
MQVLTELKSMFSYSIVPIIVLLVLIIIIIIILKLINKIELKKQVVIPNHKELIDIKQRYLLRIQELENNLNNNSISSRKAYQSLSNLIRTFIYEATNIKVQNYTLKEINTLNMPILSDLVTEYYDPEFSVISKGNIISSINKTKGVIEKWN